MRLPLNDTQYALLTFSFQILDSYVFSLPCTTRTPMNNSIPDSRADDQRRSAETSEKLESPSQDPWSNSLINSLEKNKGPTHYDSGCQKKSIQRQFADAWCIVAAATTPSCAIEVEYTKSVF